MRTILLGGPILVPQDETFRHGQPPTRRILFHSAEQFHHTECMRGFRPGPMVVERAG